jgi:hypothetical protein
VLKRVNYIILFGMVEVKSVKPACVSTANNRMHPPDFIGYSTGKLEVVSRLLSAADLQRIYLVFSSHIVCHPQLFLFFFTPISYEQRNKIRSNERKTAFFSSPISSNFQHQTPEAGAP